MRLQLETEDMLILRDGRPLGVMGQFGGNSINGQYLQTLAGLLRKVVEIGISNDFFADKKNLDKVLEMGVVKIIAFNESPMATWKEMFI